MALLIPYLTFSKFNTLRLIAFYRRIVTDSKDACGTVVFLLLM
ncbi:hypothetical protein [Bacillus sp. NTK074B]